ncbi:hypothetical protein H072_3030 [Dactylellina haptotyla CBS 200.50]|uniref:glutathione-specific gamma-glutamylcyclotransferase n=1 Tax=Dactylellina haptotyla (strain CBS 200.50) TaxID=1284197 RepID=S8AJ23_DACHA|nr:hypothetical protein H072_3030 [Dactylellina haptotyla CBS 200.50]
MNDPLDNGEAFWIFGYGEDHRGTPEAPGRVVTLIEQETDEPVWGAAYLIAPSEVERIKAYLDLREINGYTIHRHPVYHNSRTSESEDIPNPITAILYIGTPDNPQFVGPPESTSALAQHILDSRGPSGENKEYLYNLYTALEQLAPEAHDSHISELAKAAAKIEGVSLDIPVEPSS